MKRLFVIVIAVTLIMSCQKEDEILDQETTSNFLKLKYMPMSVGNYWVYEHFLIDSLGNETSLGKYDSVVITRDSMIRNKKFFVLEGTNYPYNRSGERMIIDLLRDSLGYLVNQNGSIRFAQYNFSDTLEIKVETHQDDTLYFMYCKMEKYDDLVTVPAGSFEVLNFRGEIYNHMYATPKKDERYLNNYYAKNVGKIVSTYYYLMLSESTYYERRLIRYSINE